ncbi:PQQ-dependent sugar dehydrogenase [Ferruginibacter sp.]
MQSKLLFSVTAVTAIFFGCSGNSNTAKNENIKTSGDTTSTTAAAIKMPNAHYKPAFEGQTRIKAVTTTTAYKVEKIAEKLGRPWAIIALPDGKLLLTEKSGYMEIHNADGALVKKITGFPKVDDNGQGGLLDVALDPEFATNKTIYWSFSEKYGKGNLTAVAKGQLNENDSMIKNPKVIFRATPELNSEYHFGSRLIFDKEGYLFVSSGERSVLEGRKQSQWLNSGMGKIFRITKDGKAAPGNPFINQSTAKPEIYSYGHRNPQSLDFNPVTGDLWEAEFGPQGGDELNIIKPGKNYGWPIITYGIEYNGSKIGDAIQQKEGMEQPVYFWDPVLSPGGMVFYTGDAIPEWKNNLFISGLSSTRIVRLVIENNKVVGEEALLTDQKERIRDITQYNGVLYAVSDFGILFRISKK